jgi:hypothetical protein
MSKLLCVVVTECGECPYYEKSDKGGNHCAAPNRYVKLASIKMIPPDCPLPTTNETML